MNDKPQQQSLPEKVLRRHVEILEDLLPDVSRLVMDEGQPIDTLLNAFFRAHRELGSRDRRFLAQAFFSYFRWYGWTVIRLKLSPSQAALLGTALDTTELPPSFKHLETQCSLPFEIVPLGDKTVEEKRDFLNEQVQSDPAAAPLQISDLVRPDFQDVIDPAVADRCIIEFQKRPPTWLRTRKSSDEIARILTQQNISVQQHDRLMEALAVEGGLSLASVLAEHGGQFVVQDLASQCVGLICAPAEGADWWDCCAGSGGKTMHLMDLMQQNGKVLATDMRAATLKELKKRIRKHGIRHIRTQPFNAVSDEPFKKLFDGVLVDAPCSGWGTWGRNPDARWRTSRRDVIQNAGRQLKILDNAAWCVKPGSALVYAVCTFTRPETEEVVMNFLDRHANFKLDPFPNPLTGEATDGQLQIWPWDANCDGMYIARFVRTGD